MKPKHNEHSEDQNETPNENKSETLDEISGTPPDERDTTIAQLKDQLLRKAAELENVKRRSEVERMEFVIYANEALLKELLPTIDNLERTLAAASQANDHEAIAKGVELIHANFAKVLEKLGVTPIESVGKPFDVNLHEALMRMKREGVPTDTIIEEVERGYMFRDKVLRHAKVVVAE